METCYEAKQKAMMNPAEIMNEVHAIKVVKLKSLLLTPLLFVAIQYAMNYLFSVCSEVHTHEDAC